MLATSTSSCDRVQEDRVPFRVLRRRSSARGRPRAGRRRRRPRNARPAAALSAGPPARIDHRPHVRDHVPRAGRRGLCLHVRLERRPRLLIHHSDFVARMPMLLSGRATRRGHKTDTSETTRATHRDASPAACAREDKRAIADRNAPSRAAPEGWSRVRFAHAGPTTNQRLLGVGEWTTGAVKVA